MARKTSTTTQEAGTATAETKRVTSLEPKDGKALTSLEEAVVRMHHGVSVRPDAQLPTNGVTDEVMGSLFEMEVRAHVETGRIDELPDVPAKDGAAPAAAPSSARARRVVEELKKKT